MADSMEGRRVVFLEIEEWEKDYICRNLPAPWEVSFYGGDLQQIKEDSICDADVLSIFIYSQATGVTLERFPRLRFIATRSTGFDHIDLEYCRSRGISVSNVPTYGSNTVAEHTFALILALSRKVHQAYDRTVKGDFSLDGLRGFDLREKTLGVIGTGAIGKHVIRIAKGFLMRVLAYDMMPDPALADVLDFSYVELSELLKGSDVITLHCPLTRDTYHLLNRERLSQVKRGSLLINTARGGLIDTEALLWALDEGILGGAGLDVLEEEETIKEERQIFSSAFDQKRLATIVQQHILLRRENVVVTPHIAFNSHEALERIIVTTLENIVAFLEGRPRNVVV